MKPSFLRGVPPNCRGVELCGTRRTVLSAVAAVLPSLDAIEVPRSHPLACVHGGFRTVRSHPHMPRTVEHGACQGHRYARR